MNTVRLIMLAILINIIAAIAASPNATNYTVQYNEILGKQNTLEQKAGYDRETLKSKDLITNIIATAQSAIETLIKALQFIWFIGGILWSNMANPFIKASSGQSTIEQWGYLLMGLITTGINLLLALEFWDKIINKKISTGSG